MKKISDFNALYNKAEEVDKEIFAEMRSNIMLVSGNHYTKKNDRFWNRLRDSRDISVDKKLRLTKNHIQRITKIYRNNLMKYSPGVRVVPQLDSELQDIKSAEMNQSVWNHIKEMNHFKKLVPCLAQDFIDIGEVAVKLYYDPNKGYLKGYEPLIDELGQMVLDPMSGQPVPDENKPAFSGKLCIERIHAFNLMRDPDAKTIDESEYLIIRKMVDIKTVKSMIENEEEKNKVHASKDETFMVFDGADGKYKKSDDQVLVKEIYYRPSKDFPKGYYYIMTKEVIITEGELPGGVFPICWEGFDEIQTTPRKRSIIKQLRPYQAEINRAASQIATHQITLGDDKLVINSSAKVQQGGLLPGVRVIKTNSVGVNGGIHVIPGRAGEQFLGYMSSQIDEMYSVANIEEDMKKNESGNMDIWGSLFGSVKNKKEFSLYSDSFESFLTDICKKSLELARYHFPDDEVIQMVGRKEQVNMEEFKNNQNIGYLIKVEPSTDDADSIMGKQMLINHTLQYVGNQLSREDIGKVLKESPMGDIGQIFEDFTVDYDNAKNDILQLERGQMPMLSKYENIQYKIQRITARMKSSDFDYLNPQVQQLFQQFLMMCEQLEAQKAAEIQRAQSGFIPDGGGMITINGIKDEEGKVMRVPYASLEWLIKKLAEQGSLQQELESNVQNEGAISDISQMMTNGG